MKVEVEFVREFTGHRSSVYTLFAGRDPSIFYSGSGDGLVVEWDLNDVAGTGKAVANTGAVIYAGCYLAASHEVIAGTRGGGLYSFDTATNAKSGYSEAKGDYFDLVPHGENTVLAACGHGFIYQETRIAQGFEVDRYAHPSDKSARAIVLSPDKKIMATGWSDGRIRIYDAAPFTKKPGKIPEFKEKNSFPAHEPSVFTLLYTPDGSKLISGGRDAQIKVWDTRDYSLLKTIPAHWFTINHLALSPDGKLFASASRDKSVKIWDAATFELLKVIDLRQFPAHTHSVNRLLWTPYENILLSAGDDRRIKAWKIVLG